MPASPTPHRPLIALADPEWVGHRETYFREFVRSLFRVGADVIALCPNPERISQLSNEAGTENMLVTGRLTEPSRPPLLASLPQDPITTLKRWRATLAALKVAEKEAGRPADLIFLPWVDSYLRASLSPALALRSVDRPWAGLYFRPYHLDPSGRPQGLAQRAVKGDDLLRAASCTAVAVLDETATPALSSYTGKPVVLFPDITDESPPDDSASFAQTIRQAAAGRRVIGLVGLEKRKGVTTMLRAADLAAASQKPWLFVLAGALNLSQFSEEDRQLVQSHLDKYQRGESSNVIFQQPLAPIPDGPVFNGVMNAFDVFFTGYHDFQGSSNVLTKASILEKPVICTEAGCMGVRTKAYNLGLNIPQGDAAACGEAIEKVLSGVNWEGAPLNPRFSEYHSLHNRNRLDEAFRELIASLPR